MAILDILVFPHEGLRKIASPVERVDEDVSQLADDMLETMYAANGIGLAATQVNVHKRVFVMDISQTRDQPKVLINPEIIEAEGEQVGEEGCLSIPEIYAPVTRAELIKVQALDASGEKFEIQAQDLEAVCIQHEIDHLNGRMFIDHLSRLKQDRLRKKFLKLTRSNK